MNSRRIGQIAGTVVWLITGIGYGASFSLSGPNQTGNTIVVASGATFTVTAQVNAPEAGNTFEVFLGYDKSNAAAPGLTGSPTLNKLVLVSSPSYIAGSIDGARFDVWRSAKAATAHEANNAALGGRPYGLKVVGAGHANTAAGSLTLFSVTFQNNMAAGDNTSIVISNAGAGASYTTAWKSGGTSNRGGYTLQVVSAVPTPTPVPVAGDANRDGVVSFADFAVLQNHYGQSGMGWDQGDFNGDGRVTFEDFSILQNHYGQSQAGSAPAGEALAATGVPCLPAGGVLLAGLFLAVLGLGLARTR